MSERTPEQVAADDARHRIQRLARLAWRVAMRKHGMRSLLYTERPEHEEHSRRVEEAEEYEAKRRDKRK